MINIEILFSHDDFEKCLKWYNLAFKDKHPSKEDERVFHKLEILVESMRKEDELDREDDD